MRISSKLLCTNQSLLEKVPKEISPGGIAIDRNDMKTTREEAYPISLAQEGKSFSVVTNGADV